MCSIRSGCGFAMMLVVALAMTAAGCQPVSKHQSPSPVNNTPLVVDEAMQIRDWDRSTNYYANGATVAGGTGYCWETADWVKEGDRKFVDGPVAVLNFVSMPVGLFVNSPFEKQVIHGEIIPPSYTGQPPLPGAPQTSNGVATEATEAPAPAAVEPGTPPPAPPAVETPPPPPSTESLPPLPAPSDTPTPPSPSDTPAPPPVAPAPPPTAESAPPAAPATPEPPAPSSVPTPPTEPLNK